MAGWWFSVYVKSSGSLEVLLYHWMVNARRAYLESSSAGLEYWSSEKLEKARGDKAS